MTIASLDKKIKNIILDLYPTAKLSTKYGGTLFSTNKSEHFCGVFSYKNHVSIEFPFGYKLNDPKNMLEGSGQYRRHLKLYPNEDIPTRPLKTILNEAHNLSEL